MTAKRKVIVTSGNNALPKHLIGNTYEAAAPDGSIVDIVVVDAELEPNGDVKYERGLDTDRPKPGVVNLKSAAFYQARLAHFKNTGDNVCNVVPATSYCLVRGKNMTHGNAVTYMYRKFFGDVWRICDKSETEHVLRNYGYKELLCILEQHEALSMKITAEGDVCFTGLNHIYSSELDEDITRLTLMSEHVRYGV